MDNKKTKIKKDNLTYKGKVTVELLRGNKPYKKITINNRGGIQLFNFLGNCLIGTFDRAGFPSRIRLYQVGGGGETELTTSSISVNDVEFFPASTNNSSCSVIYTFIIPYTAVVAGNCNLIRLFNAESSNLISEYSAEVSLTTPIVISGDSNVRIKWNLIISNAEE